MFKQMWKNKPMKNESEGWCCTLTPVSSIFHKVNGFFSCWCISVVYGQISFHSSELWKLLSNLALPIMGVSLEVLSCVWVWRSGIKPATHQLQSAPRPLGQPAACDLFIQSRNKQPSCLSMAVYCESQLFVLPQSEKCLLSKWSENK